jgi:hypothetical protein
MSVPYCASAAGETMVPRLPALKLSAKTDGNAPNGALSTNSTVCGSTARIEAIWLA